MTASELIIILQQSVPADTAVYALRGIDLERVLTNCSDTDQSPMVDYALT